MDNTLRDRLITAIKWKDTDIERVISSARRAGFILQRQGVSPEEFFLISMGKNPFVTGILLQHAYKIRDIETEVYEKCKAALVNECLNKMEYYLQEHRLGNIHYEKNDEIISLYVAAVLMLDNHNLLNRAFACVQALLENKEDALSFAQKVVHLLHYTGKITELCALFYLFMYRFLTIEYAEHVAYSQGIEIPVSHNIPVPLKELIDEALRNEHMRYIDLVLKVFVNVRLNQLDIQPENLMALTMQVHNENIFRGLLLAEKLISTDMETSIDALEKWWMLLNKYQNTENPYWMERKNWFHTYYFSRRIYYDPQNAGQYIEQSPVLEESSFKVRKLNEVIQNTMETLFMAGEKLVFEYMDKLGKGNVFLFDTDEEYYPRFEKNPSFDHEEAISNLLKLGYRTTEMIAIYMNSFLRSSYPIALFMSRIFGNLKELEINGDYADVRQYFCQYKIAARVKRTNDVLGLLMHNVVNNQKNVYFSPGWWREYSNYCMQTLDEDRKVYCYITTINLNNFYPHVELHLKEEERLLAKDYYADNFNCFLNALKEIEEDKVLTTEKNSEIVRLHFPLPLSDENSIKMHLQILDCVIALSENRQSPRYLINMFNFMISGKLNIYKYRFEQKLPQALTYDLKEQVRAKWKRFCALDVTLEDVFFVYINTMFKHCITFSQLLLKYHNPDFPIMDLSKLLSEHTDYCFSGRIINISEDTRTPQTVYYINVTPYDFYSGEAGHYDGFSYRTEIVPRYEKGQHCFFRISAYNSRTNTFFIKELMNQQKKSTKFL